GTKFDKLRHNLKQSASRSNEAYDELAAGSLVRFPDASAEADVYRHSGALPGSRYWGEHRHIQPDQHHSSKAASVSGSQPARDDLVRSARPSRPTQRGHCLQLPRVTRTGEVLRTDRDDSDQRL